MLSRKFQAAVLVIGAIAFGGSLTGCSSSSDPEVISDYVTKNALEINGRIVDATTGDPIDGVAVTVSGADAASIDATSADALPGGIVTYSADKQELSVTFLARKDGYLDTGIELSTKDSDQAEFVIRMVKVDNPPVGTAVAQEDIKDKVDSSGAVSSEIKVSAKVTNSSNVNNEQTEIVIPAGTDLLDKEGNPVTGELKVTVAHHSANEESSTEAFPGGFAVIAETSAPNAANSVEEEIVFVTAGFTSISIENENGDKVRQFGTNDIEVKMQIKEGTINPDTGVAIAIGENVPVWSYDEDTGKWSYEQQGSVQDLNPTDGFYDVVVQASHLSYWNLDWHYSAVCRANLKLNVVDSQNQLVTGETIFLRANFTGSSGYLYSGYIRNDGYADLRNVPLNKQMNIVARYQNASGTVLGSKTVTVTQAMCNAGTPITLQINNTQIPVKRPVTVKAKSICANGEVDNDNLVLRTYLYADGRYLSSGYTPLTSNALEGSQLKSYVYKRSIQNGTIDGTDYYGYYSTKELTVGSSAANNIINYTVTLDGNTQKCIDAAANTGTTGATDLNTNQ
ncbi:hypothetical protein [Thiomicrorhabdus sp.]|uniref:hypothetical protein n=1 Tax=Thiomicrorhabdus sp. TaxID=2039724 RepID=UPI0029C6D160|nr:hypothetical protein [Thiomicrorhabdus sp.]